MRRAAITASPAYRATEAPTWPEGKLDVGGAASSWVTAGRGRSTNAVTTTKTADCAATETARNMASTRCATRGSTSRAITQTRVTAMTTSVPASTESHLESVMVAPSRCAPDSRTAPASSDNGQCRAAGPVTNRPRATIKAAWTGRNSRSQAPRAVEPYLRIMRIVWPVRA